MVNYWYIFRIQLYGRDELVGRINYNCNHFMKEVVWKFLDWVEKLEDISIKTYHVFRYPRNMIRFRILVEGEEITAEMIKKVQNDFRGRVDDYRQEGKREHFIDNDAGVDFNNEKTLNAVSGAYGGEHALWLCLDFMNIMAELDRTLLSLRSETTQPEIFQNAILDIIDFIYRDIFQINKTYPCICGNDIPIAKGEHIQGLDKKLNEFKTKFNELKDKKLIEHDINDLANNYADLAFLSFGLYSFSFTCDKCGELLDIKVR